MIKKYTLIFLLMMSILLILSRQIQTTIFFSYSDSSKYQVCAFDDTYSMIQPNKFIPGFYSEIHQKISGFSPNLNFVGTTYTWDTETNMGTGKMTILKYDNCKTIKILYEYQKPYVVSYELEINFKESNSGTDILVNTKEKISYFDLLMQYSSEFRSKLNSQFYFNIIDFKDQIYRHSREYRSGCG